MHIDDQGRLRAINPEFGFFGVAPGTSKSTNPIALGNVRNVFIETSRFIPFHFDPIRYGS